MVPHLIVLGVLSGAEPEPEPGIGDVTAPAGRTATIRASNVTGGAGAGIPRDAYYWPDALDPRDLSDFAFDWSTQLKDGEKIARILDVSMSALGAQYGVTIESADGRGPIIDEGGTKTGLWFSVEESFRNHAVFSNDGTPFPISTWVETDSVPSRKLERTSVLTVRQR